VFHPPFSGFSFNLRVGIKPPSFFLAALLPPSFLSCITDCSETAQTLRRPFIPPLNSPISDPPLCPYTRSHNFAPVSFFHSNELTKLVIAPLLFPFPLLLQSSWDLPFPECYIVVSFCFSPLSTNRFPPLHASFFVRANPSSAYFLLSPRTPGPSLFFFVSTMSRLFYNILRVEIHVFKTPLPPPSHRPL